MHARRERHALHDGAGLLGGHVTAEELAALHAELCVGRLVGGRAVARGERKERDEQRDEERAHQKPTTARTVNESSASVVGAPVTSRPSAFFRRSYSPTSRAFL